MPRASPIQTSLNRGELSPLLFGRVDLDQYKNGLALCRDTIPLVQGGATRRPGTMYVNQTKFSSTRKSRLVKFIFSVTQAYVIEFGHLYCRFFRNEAIITNTPVAITGATAANPVVITAAAHGFANGDKIVISGVSGMRQINNLEFTAANVAANTFELSGINGTAYDAYTSGGSAAKPYEMVTTYTESDLFQLKFAQSADTLYVTHPIYPPAKITRTGHTSWTTTNIVFLDGPYLNTNATSTTLTLSATTGALTVTASAAVFTLVTDVGRLIRWKDAAGNWTWLRITAVASTTSASATIIGPDASATTATTSWRLGVWSITTGYPAAVCFYQDRLFFAGATNYPQRLDGSTTGDYENMAPTNATSGTVVASNAVAFTLNDNNVNVIRWLAATEKGLAAGSVGSEWIIRPADASGSLSPTNISATPSTTYGSANVSPVQSDKAVLFLNRTGRKIRELAYVYQVDGFKAPDLTVLAEHITRGGITEMAFAQNPQAVIWGVRADGLLTGLTYEREESVVGWHLHTIAGAFSTGTAIVESVAVIPTSDGSRDELWMVVKRTVNGATVRYIEYMTKLWEHGDVQANAFHVDCGLTYSGVAVTSLGGLGYIEGQVVTILADGAAHPTKTVTNGKITLDRSASTVQIGLGYNSDGATLRPEAGAADGTAQGKTQRTNKVSMRIFDGLGLKVGPDVDHLDTVVFRDTSDDVGVAVPLFTGDVEIPWDGDYSKNNTIYWRWEGAFPGTVLALMPQLTTQDAG